jgi:hypothetical protein
VNSDSGKPVKVFTITPESVLTIDQNRCSRCARISVQVRPEYASKGAKSIAASVRQKLKNRAAQDNRPFAELLQYYAMERFHYRLTQSKHADRFILKGALMLRVWQSADFSTLSRPMMDIDMLGKINNDMDGICATVADIVSIDIDDGLVFDSATIKGEIIKEGADYEGVRIRFIGTLENAKVNMQIDVGFGDVVFPCPLESELSGLPDFLRRNYSVIAVKVLLLKNLRP